MAVAEATHSAQSIPHKSCKCHGCGAEMLPANNSCLSGESLPVSIFIALKIEIDIIGLGATGKLLTVIVPQEEDEEDADDGDGFGLRF